eukprot:COSAG01_NODE_18449_length_1075_cov_1.084016_2_plen_59_part_01
MGLLKGPPQLTGDVKRKFAQEEVRSDIDYPPDSGRRIGNVPAENCHDAYGHQESTAPEN